MMVAKLLHACFGPPADVCFCDAELKNSSFALSPAVMAVREGLVVSRDSESPC